MEQERYDLKLLIESIRNEYENKICELNEDLRTLTNDFKSQQTKTATKLNERQKYMELINDLQENNQQITGQLNKVARMRALIKFLSVFMKSLDC